MNKKLLSLLLATIFYLNFCLAFDNAHFYKAPYFHATKSWKTRDWLSSFDAHYAHGDTCKGRNCHGNTDTNFSLYGHHNLLYLTSGVPQPTLSSAVQGYVTAINTKRTNFANNHPANRESFGCTEFSGKFSVEEFVFNYRQNILLGFFAELNIPIRKLKTGCLTLVDRSPESTTPGEVFTKTDQAWVNFRDNLDTILQEYGFDCYSPGSQHTSLGDIALLAGWQRTFRALPSFFRYIKLSLKLGVLFPSGNIRDFQKPFSIEPGYNGHLGIPARADVIFGLSHDIYWGNYAGFLTFSSKEHDRYPIKTDLHQNGFIKLFRARVRESAGNLFDFGTYLKLDHFFKGLSALAGYSYNRQTKTTLTLLDSCNHTTNEIINDDNRLKNWHMHVLHVWAEYDFSIHKFFRQRRWKPRVSLFYDHPFSGKRIFTNPFFGGAVGCDLRWDF